jgi:hypothetical protein
MPTDKKKAFYGNMDREALRKHIAGVPHKQLRCRGCCQLIWVHEDCKPKQTYCVDCSDNIYHITRKHRGRN